MRQVVTATIVLVSGVWLISVWNGGAIATDTPVAVLGTDAVVILLPQSPSVERVTFDLAREFEALASVEQDDRISRALERIAADMDLLRGIAATPVDMFDNREAAATATPVYDIQLDSASVIVTVATVELVPGFGSTAASREHEDGHALINLTVARRCAAAALEASVNDGRRGEALINSIIIRLAAAGDPVHDTYHQYVESARYGQHIRYAEQALADVTGC